MKMTRDELEYAISQYLDGTLMPLERDALEERLAGDADARQILAEYSKLDAALKSSMPAPSIAWDRLAKEICQLIQTEEAPVRHYSFKSSAWIRVLAIAASILLAVSVTVHLLTSNSTPNSTRTQGTLIVTGPAVEQSNSPAIAEISIGHSATVADNWRAAEEVTARPSVVMIDQARPSGQDGELY